MFGDAVDYHILKPLTHSHNRMTEEELDVQSEKPSYTLDDARAYTSKAQKLYFGRRLPVDPVLSYLDVGCGTGRLSVGLSVLGMKDITGVDIMARNIATAKSVSQSLPAENRPKFHLMSSEEVIGKTYDVVIALAVMEHTSCPDNFLKKICELLKPNGRAYLSMTPFHGPLGDHMSGFFKVQIPWRGVLFSEAAVLRLRAECFRPTDNVKRYQDIAGGLNLMTISQYLRYVNEARLEVVSNNFDPHFKHYKRLWPLYPLSWALTRVPRVRDFFTFNVYSIVRRRAVT